MNLIVRPAAEQDALEAYIWYENHREELGKEFLVCVRDLMREIQEFPEAYAKVYSSLRRAGLRRFPYHIYYRINGHIEVIAILHASGLSSEK